MDIAEVRNVPIGTKSTSLSSYIVECLKVLEGSGLAHEVHGMGTIIEGNLPELFEVVLKMHEMPFQAGEGGSFDPYPFLQGELNNKSS
jgi:uncharacterized protein (TIGR00106 family)